MASLDVTPRPDAMAAPAAERCRQSTDAGKYLVDLTHERPLCPLEKGDWKEKSECLLVLHNDLHLPRILTRSKTQSEF